MTSLTPVLALHIATGLMATATGLAPILTPKGSRAHRLSGRLFTGLMAILLAAAWLMTALHFSVYFLALSATATITVFSGVRVLGRKRPDLDPRQRARCVDWMAALGVAGIGLSVLALIVAGKAPGNTAVSTALAVAALLWGGWDLWRFIQPTAWPFSPQLWTWEHLVKMLSAYGAVLSAFSGNFLTVLPAPWSQLWPTLLFQPMAAIWITVLILRRPRGPAHG